MTQYHLSPSDVPNLIRGTFPTWKGKKVRLQAAETVTISNLNWGGGTRSQYRACTLSGQPTGNADAANQTAPWNNPVEGKPVQIPTGHVLVEHSIFCGKDAGLTIYVHPQDMPRYLPTAGADTLTPEEVIVLKCIRTYISSYRRQEAQREGITAAQYETAVSSLKEKGLLSKSGGLTLAGKNTAQG